MNMKTHAKLFLASVLALGASAAQADTIRLADIYTNDCSGVESEVRLLKSADADVSTSCEFGGFWMHGNYYRYRMQTYIDVPYVLRPGTSVDLGNIDTNNCDHARDIIALLDSRAVSVDTFCEAGLFEGHNGHIYRYRLHTTARMN